MQYKGPSLNRSQVAEMYSISLTTLRTWLVEIPEKLNIGRRRILRPKEINILFEEWGIPDDFKAPSKKVD